ncbi:sensor histidine kinase [Massilia sp. S19_KUP03_FR1]|uniref:sensor histidine kinase n=1 Tax=Massilia sp. S19_KUP03_FR1 TaxID=3025503 RepID=UPI002FCCE853
MPSQQAKLKHVAHPLDFLPFVRRWSRTPLRSIVLTCVLGMLIGAIVTTIQAAFSDKIHFSNAVVPVIVIGNSVGFTIHGGLVLLAVLTRGWSHRQSGTVRSLYYVTAVSILSFIGVALGNALLRGRNPWHYVTHFQELAHVLPFTFGLAVLLLIMTSVGQRRAEAEVQRLRQREELAATAQLLAEAKLRALQAQIEPHFLYNTLANVLGLIDTQPAQARHMLERFIDFLRASLHASRAESATVGAELDLAAAYLDVLAVRMGKRLHYRIEADAAARASGIAPMLIQPLVENAVMHGLEPKIAGGTIVVRAQRSGDTLQVDIADDGVGIGNAPARAGGGVGMANVKARALSVHGDGARLQLLDNPGGGAIVRLLLPISSKVPSSTSPQP